MTTTRRLTAILVLLALAVALVPHERAVACSCAEPTIDDLQQQAPGAIVLRVRRIDQDGGSRGAGAVEEVLVSPTAPRTVGEQVPLALDDGASCRPWVAVGDVAVLAFDPDGDGWRTRECGQLPPTTGLDPVSADPAATGPAAAVLAGRFPGADVVTLDDHLRVLAATPLGIGAGELRPCGDDVLVSTVDDQGIPWLARLALPNLELVTGIRVADRPDAEVQVVDAACRDGRIDVVAGTWGPDGRDLQLLRDAGTDPEVLDLPAAEDAAFVGDDVVFVRNAPDGTGFRVHRFDLAAGTTRTLFALEGAGSHELTVAPDERHALVRASHDEPLLLVIDLDEGGEVARATGWWQPAQRPWIDAEHVLQQDEGAGGIGGTGRAHHRIVALDLEPVATLEPAPGWSAAAGAGTVLRTSGDGLTVLDAAGDTIRTAPHRWAAGAFDVLPLASVAPGEVSDPIPLPAVDPALAEAARDGGAGPDGPTPAGLAWVVPVAVGAVLLAGGVLAARGPRRRRRRASGSTAT